MDFLGILMLAGVITMTLALVLSIRRFYKSGKFGSLCPKCEKRLRETLRIGQDSFEYSYSCKNGCVKYLNLEQVKKLQPGS